MAEEKKQNWFKRWFFPTKQEGESYWSNFIRKFYFSDSRGKSSLTVTILFFVMIMVASVTISSIKIAHKVESKVTYQPSGERIEETKPIGYSDQFIYLLISLSVVITGSYYAKERHHRLNGKAGEKGMVGQLVEKGREKLQVYLEEAPEKPPEQEKPGENAEGKPPVME